jgi:hypothetical protein
VTLPASNATPAASGQEHLGELAAAAAILLLLAHDAAAEAFERRVAISATTSVQLTAQTLITWTARTWVTRYGSLDTRIDPGQWADLRPLVIREIRAAATTIDPAPAVAASVRDAYALGIEQAAEELGVPAVPDLLGSALPSPVVRDEQPPRIDTRRATPKPSRIRPAPPAAEEMAQSTTTTARIRYEKAERLVSAVPVETHAELVEALSPAQAAVNDVDRDTRTVVNTALNEGAAAVAEHHDADLLWMSERDACVVCLALAGTVVAHNEDFPIHATFGAKPTEWRTPSGGLRRPPRHPRCRCRCVPWLGHVGPGPSLPEVMKREAERSVLRGWSLPSESEQVRIQAAERLLARGTTLPKTVQERARGAVRRGRFTSRDVPQISGR